MYLITTRAFFHPPPTMDRKRQEALWKDAIHDLREECPTVHPVKVVKRMRLPDDRNGECELRQEGKKKWFNIKIGKDLDFNHQIAILIHEWAHAMAWHAPECEATAHPDEWGLCVARCYRAVIHD